MADLRFFKTLRGRATLWTVGALVMGIATTWIWMASQAAWQAHLNRAYVAGLGVYETLRHDAPAPAGVTVTPAVLKSPDLGGWADLPEFEGASSSDRVTTMSIIDDVSGISTGTRLLIHIISKDLQYPIAKLAPDIDQHPAARFGNLTRLLASYCSHPMVYARLDQGAWQRIDGTQIWGCEAGPNDYRLIAAALLVIATIILLSQVTDTSAQFSRFVSDLKTRERVGDGQLIDETGPEELREIIRSLNDYLALERERLEKRAMVLSGVSHDLGTPATRLRLRTALIEDEDLRTRLEVDIDQMTDMIESVLTYTRSEMNSEEPRRISLTSLVHAVVADYEDLGMPVTFHDSERPIVSRSRSVFGGGRGNLSLPQDDARRVLVNARPVALKRAITNLIDNALKYGRKATVHVQADSKTASVIIDDEGTSVTAEMLHALTGPFLRGENAAAAKGFGLGLTIVSTIARQHGGAINFEETSHGARAILSISRR